MNRHTLDVVHKAEAASAVITVVNVFGSGYQLISCGFRFMVLSLRYTMIMIVC